MLKDIGGYFELENRFEAEYYPELVRLNTGRNCLEYILKARGYRKIYLPEYSCTALMEPIYKLGIEFEKYPITINLQPKQIEAVKDDECFLAINYFGLKGKYITDLTRRQNNLIIDNTQAFFEAPLKGFDTFYSTRKFFGVADGAYLSTDYKPFKEFEQEMSWERSEHLLRRLENGAVDGYKAFLKNEQYLSGKDIRLMSDLTYRILCSVNYSSAKNRRNRNFQYLHLKLQDINGLTFNDAEIEGPMVYPLYVEDENLRKQLIEEKVFVASYWPNVLEECNPDSLEYKMAKYLLPLPVDQRYGLLDMDRICKAIYNCIKIKP